MSQKTKQLEAVKKYVIHLREGDEVAAKKILAETLETWDSLLETPKPAKRASRKPSLPKEIANKHVGLIFPTRVVKALVAHGYKTVGDISTLRPEQLVKVKGIGEVLSVEIYSTVQKLFK